MPQAPYQSKVKLHNKYHIIGFISSGTYGRVYKARSKDPENKGEFAIKKYLRHSLGGLILYLGNMLTGVSPGIRFKPDKEGEVSYTGISQSAIREMAVRIVHSFQNCKWVTNGTRRYEIAM